MQNALFDVFYTSTCVPGVCPVCVRCVSGVCPVCVRCVSGVCPVCQGTHNVSGNKPLSLFLRTHISKNGGTTELIQICIRYDVISEMWAGFTPTGLSETLLSETMRHVLEVIWSVFTLAC